MYNFFFKLYSRPLSVFSLQFYSSSYFVSTPIFYVNGAPHIGHLQSCLYADAFARTQRLLGHNVIFSTGTDEHGLKVQQAAISAKKSVSEYCTEMSQMFQGLFKKTDISYTHFIRTTDDKHKEMVQHFWKHLADNGYIRKGSYDGWYSVVDEAFVPSSQVKEIKEGSKTKMVSAETGSVVEKMVEENYVFPLSEFKKEILHWISSEDVIKPCDFIEVLKLWIEESPDELSISRPKSRLFWGIPVPSDDSQVIYVWLDALLNYLSVGYNDKNNIVWPPDCHVIGKDILKFHAIYWPAFLLAAGYKLPKQIFCHSHWTVNYEKMSKSKGNVIDPTILMNKYDCDGLRYFLLKAAVPQSDNNYSETKIHRLINSELADTLGNLLSRSCAPALNPGQIFPKFSHEAFQSILESDAEQLIKATCILPSEVKDHFRNGLFYKGLDCIMACLRDANAFMQYNKPWELVKKKDSENHDKLSTVLHVVLEVLRISGILLQPVTPDLSYRLLAKLGVPEDQRGWQNLSCFPSYHHLPNPLEGHSLGTDSCPLYIRRK